MTGPFAGEEDLSVFLVDGEHAESVTFSTDSGSVVVNGVFFDVFNDDQGIDSANQSFLCTLSEVSQVDRGDVLTRDDGRTYAVRDIQPDGTGFVSIMVHTSL